MREPLPNRSDDAALDRAWEATRPVEPSDVTWDALWARVRDGLDRAGTGAPLTLAPPRRLLPSARLALAASLLAAVTVAVATVRRPTADRAPTSVVVLAPEQSTPVSVSSETDIEIEAGEVAVIVFGSGEVEKTLLPPDNNPVAFDPTIAIYGSLETLARN